MSENLSGNMGKKIVEALKMQNSSEISETPNIVEENNDQSPQVEAEDNSRQINELYENSASEDTAASEYDMNDTNMQYTNNNFFNTPDMSNVETAFQNSLNNNLSSSDLAAVQTDVDYPNNVMILNNLVSKLPAGVTKRTGAIIIKQTMEALGIPMESVMQEAKQMRETLSAKAKECQKNIFEYKKQISTLEIKSRQYQRQAVAMNDTINLFLNAGV